MRPGTCHSLPAPRPGQRPFRPQAECAGSLRPRALQGGTPLPPALVFCSCPPLVRPRQPGISGPQALPPSTQHVSSQQRIPWARPRGTRGGGRPCPLQRGMQAGGRGSRRRAGRAHLEDEQDAAVAQEALVRVVPDVARAAEDLQRLAHARPGALGAEHLPWMRAEVSTGRRQGPPGRPRRRVGFGTGPPDPGRGASSHLTGGPKPTSPAAQDKRQETMMFAGPNTHERQF